MNNVQDKPAILEAAAVQMTFIDANRQVEVLHGIDLSINQGDFISIVGTSGSGKSTLLHVLAGLETASAGQVRIAGQDIAGLNRAQRAQLRQQHLGFVYQLHHLLPEFTAAENVAMPLLLAGQNAKLAKEKAEHWLSQVSMSHRISHRPNALSGGERQRVAIARALVNEPACVLADEPTGNLDLETALQIQQLLQTLHQQGTSFVVVTHDQAFAKLAPRQLTMQNGRIHQNEIG